jgi:hypothetical protein
MFTFVGASLLALFWTLEYVFTRDNVDILPHTGLVCLWLIGVAITFVSAMLLLQMAGRLSLGRRSHSAALNQIRQQRDAHSVI